MFSLSLPQSFLAIPKMTAPSSEGATPAARFSLFIPLSPLDFTAINGYLPHTAHLCGEFVKKISKNPKNSQKVLDFLIYIWYS